MDEGEAEDLEAEPLRGNGMDALGEAGGELRAYGFHAATLKGSDELAGLGVALGVVLADGDEVKVLGFAQVVLG